MKNAVIAADRLTIMAAYCAVMHLPAVVSRVPPQSAGCCPSAAGLRHRAGTADDVINELHNRMPLIVEQADWDDWLLGDDPAELLRPAADDVLTWHPVDPIVGNTRNDDPQLIEPVDES